MQSSSWFTSLFSRQRDYQFCPVTLAALHKAYFGWRTRTSETGSRWVFWRVGEAEKTISTNLSQELLRTTRLEEKHSLGKTLKQFRTKNPKINTRLRTTPLILLLLYLGQRAKYTLSYFKAIYSHFLPTSWSTNKLQSANFGQQTKSVHAAIVLPCL